ncbi:MAG: ATP-binding protein [Terriglobia bacterium]|nr:ATP-binding protein [Terriglobia bacterium]
MPNKGASTEWTEGYIEGLPREDDRIERKGSRIFDDENKLREELAKQLSAFANTGGGNLILGVDNQGKIDGGIPIIHKGRQSTKEWLEDIIPHLTEFEILGVGVLDIRGENPSKINPDSALYVIEIPDSERAPHQSAIDKLYYVRIGSKSLPAPHRIVEDIRNRIRHPRLEVFQVQTHHPSCDQDKFSVRVVITIKNAGNIVVTHSCLGVIADSLRFHVAGVQGCTVRAGTEFPVFDVAHTLYPAMVYVVNMTVTFDGELQIGSPSVPGSRNFFVDNRPVSEKTLTFTLYAESAPAKRQSFPIADFGVGEAEVQEAIVKHLHERSRHRSSPAGGSWMS